MQVEPHHLIFDLVMVNQRKPPLIAPFLNISNKEIYKVFDFVKSTHRCVGCKKTISQWQSKDGPCEHATLTPDEVDHYHGTCRHCGKYHSYRKSRDGFVLC